jgi:2-phospho-L-lactate transferase/gluconeogenesis factor (CofD/UPF0052 family)
MDVLQRHSTEKTKVRVVLFSGGRGSTVLSKQLINNSQVELTVAVNGYDDGASTGEVRRFLGNSLGPSDFRKNASRLARELQSCRRGLIELLDLRFPVGCSADEAMASFRIIGDESAVAYSKFHAKLKTTLADIDENSTKVVARRISCFNNELMRTQRPFSFSDCSIGNLVFAGCFLEKEKDFNTAIADYFKLLRLPTGLIENVTDGTNAYLVAIDSENRLLGSEAEIIDANKRNHIKDIYLIDRPLTGAELDWLMSASIEVMNRFLEERSQILVPNKRLLERIAEADLIIYSPGTQHSSLFPSYLIPGLGTAIAENLMAIKLLITNIQEDTEIPDSSAIDIIDKAVYYLKKNNTRSIPTPCLITHYLINNPTRKNSASQYIPLGRFETLEDPRLVKFGNYEEGMTGRHNAAKILTPFIESFIKKRETQKIALLLLDTDSLNKISETILEMLRGGIQDWLTSLTIFYDSRESLDSGFTKLLPFEVTNVSTIDGAAEGTFIKALKDRRFDYVILFESSGMYRGEDIVNLASLLNNGKLDAVWGSRRLSVKDIHESYKLRYRHNIVLGAISYLGSHILSFAYLLLYGRYISDTLSNVKAVRVTYLISNGIDLKHNCFNQNLLSLLLRNRAEVFETPVRFFSISPKRIKRTTVLLFSIFWWRFKPLKDIGSSNDIAQRFTAKSSGDQTLSDQKNQNIPT